MTLNGAGWMVRRSHHVRIDEDRLFQLAGPAFWQGKIL